jgi:hypothetical protein
LYFVSTNCSIATNSKDFVFPCFNCSCIRFYLIPLPPSIWNVFWLIIDLSGLSLECANWWHCMKRFQYFITLAFLNGILPTFTIEYDRTWTYLEEKYIGFCDRPQKLDQWNGTRLDTWTQQYSQLEKF